MAYIRTHLLQLTFVGRNNKVSSIKRKPKKLPHCDYDLPTRIRAGARHVLMHRVILRQSTNTRTCGHN